MNCVQLISNIQIFYIVYPLLLFTLFTGVIVQVERLVDRLQSSTLLNDRRDACRELKGLSRAYRVEVGTQGMDVLRQVLDMDRTDCEIVALALDTLCNITNPKVFEEEGNVYTYMAVPFNLAGTIFANI